jgi:hypothetical protein
MRRPRPGAALHPSRETLIDRHFLPYLDVCEPIKVGKALFSVSRVDTMTDAEPGTPGGRASPLELTARFSFPATTGVVGIII